MTACRCLRTRPEMPVASDESDLRKAHLITVDVVDVLHGVRLPEFWLRARPDASGNKHWRPRVSVATNERAMQSRRGCSR
jgi:hypothetical protein